MKEKRYFYVPDAAHGCELPEQEATHAVRVLRMVVGDELFLMDGLGTVFRAEIVSVDRHHCRYTILEPIREARAWQGRIHLAIAPTKDIGRMEWMAEKATEIGFDELTFLNCQNSERHIVKTERIEKIVVAATKQSRKPWKPIVNPMVSFSNFVTRHQGHNHYLCHCYEDHERKDFYSEASAHVTSDELVVMVGPEGDFSEEEVRQAQVLGWESVSLGSSRLRTETAGLSAVMMAHLARRISMVEPNI